MKIYDAEGDELSIRNAPDCTMRMAIRPTGGAEFGSEGRIVITSGRAILTDWVFDCGWILSALPTRRIKACALAAAANNIHSGYTDGLEFWVKESTNA